MPEKSLSYQLAESIHVSFFSPASNLTPKEISQTGIKADIAKPYMTERLSVSGTEDGNLAYQTLSKSQKNGYFILTTVYREGKTQFARITPNSPPEAIPVLASTLFMQALLDLAETRLSS